jgi:hypothetical protein
MKKTSLKLNLLLSGLSIFTPGISSMDDLNDLAGYNTFTNPIQQQTININNTNTTKTINILQKENPVLDFFKFFIHFCKADTTNYKNYMENLNMYNMLYSTSIPILNQSAFEILVNIPVQLNNVLEVKNQGLLLFKVALPYKQQNFLALTANKLKQKVTEELDNLEEYQLGHKALERIKDLLITDAIKNNYSITSDDVLNIYNYTNRIFTILLNEDNYAKHFGSQVADLMGKNITDQQKNINNLKTNMQNAESILSYLKEYSQMNQDHLIPVQEIVNYFQQRIVKSDYIVEIFLFILTHFINIVPNDILVSEPNTFAFFNAGINKNQEVVLSTPQLAFEYMYHQQKENMIAKNFNYQTILTNNLDSFLPTLESLKKLEEKKWHFNLFNSKDVFFLLTSHGKDQNRTIHTVLLNSRLILGMSVLSSDELAQYRLVFSNLLHVFTKQKKSLNDIDYLHKQFAASAFIGTLIVDTYPRLFEQLLTNYSNEWIQTLINFDNLLKRKINSMPANSREIPYLKDLAQDLSELILINTNCQKNFSKHIQEIKVLSKDHRGNIILSINNQEDISLNENTNSAHNKIATQVLNNIFTLKQK